MVRKSICFYLFASIFIFQNNLNAQLDTIKISKRKKIIGIESGIDGLFSMVPEYDFIRGDILPYYYSNVTESIRGTAVMWHVGARTELRTFNNLWGLVLGVKYSHLSCAIGKESYFSSPSSFFYFLDNQNGLSTSYLRVKEISREMDYIGIPVEIRRLKSSYENIRYYIKLGLDLNFLLNEKSDVLFYNESLEGNEGLVLSKFEKPTPFFSTIYLSNGLNFDKIPNLDLELVFPYVVINQDNTNLISIHSGIGFKIAVCFPY